MADEVPGWATGFLASFSAGTRVAGYRLEAPIGRGGMAVVFRALDERLQRQVALKILAPALAADEAFRHRFIRESRSAAAVDDPHIIPVFEAGDAHGVLFIAMRYVPGGDARTLVQKAGALSPARAAGIISAVASALDAAHAAGLVHRDVKPANMLVDARPGRPDHVYLSDFGLTKGAVSSTGLTGAGQFLGTLDYCAPEQIEGRPVDGRTDEYALACAAFELLSGAPPFARNEGMAVLYAQLSAPPPLLTSRRPGLPPAADAVLARAMAKAPGDRYASCREFADALRAAFGLPLYDADPGASPAPDHPPTEVVSLSGPETTDGARQGRPQPGHLPGVSGGAATGPVGGSRRRRAGLVALAGVAVLAVGGATAAVVLTRSSPGGGRPASLATTFSAPVASSRPAASRPASSSAGTPARGTGAPAVVPAIVRTLADPGTGTRHVNSVAFSPNGQRLATGDANGNAYLWATNTGQQASTLSGSGGAKVFAVAFSPDGTVVATGDGNGSTGLWNAVTGSLLTTFQDPGGLAVNSVAFSPDGRMMATGDKNGSTYLWRVSRTTHAATLASTLPDPAGAGIWAVAFSPDGGKLASGDFHGDTYLWNVTAAGGSPAGPFTMPGGKYVTAVAFSPDGASLATGDLYGDTYVWNVSSGGHFVISEPDTVWGVAFSRNGMLAIADADGITYLWDMAARRPTGTLNDPGTGADGVGAVAFSTDGRMLAAGDTNGSTYLWKVG
jgi:serine/threonine-protein kinase